MAAPRRLFPSIAALRALESLDRLGSASAAADELALTQGAISRQIKTLEAQLGQPLADRRGKRLTLTQDGADYAADIRGALDQIARAALRFAPGPVGGALSLAILPAFGMRWLMPRLTDFARRHPDVTINMTTRLEPFDLALSEFDAAIHYGHADRPGAGHLLLRHEQMIAVAAPSLLEGRMLATPADLLRLPLLHIQTRPQAWADWFLHHGLTPPRRLPGSNYDQFATITQAALHGLGVALMPDYLVEQDIATGRLLRAFGGPVEADGAYYLTWPEPRADRPALRLFRDWLAEQVEPEDPLPR